MEMTQLKIQYLKQDIISCGEIVAQIDKELGGSLNAEQVIRLEEEKRSVILDARSERQQLADVGIFQFGNIFSDMKHLEIVN